MQKIYPVFDETATVDEVEISLKPASGPMSASIKPPTQAGSGSSNSLVQLHDLPPDVMYQVLQHLGCQDVARLKLCSKRLTGNVRAGCQHWAPKVEALMHKSNQVMQLWERIQQQKQQLSGLRCVCHPITLCPCMVLGYSSVCEA